MKNDGENLCKIQGIYPAREDVVKIKHTLDSIIYEMMKESLSTK